MAAALAQKLCEAVENEDAREVENLLDGGADPNLVLPNGIAAIHLASGKESESALRCLKLILEKGGDPNVRSIEELTPVHVASSWGCCKALICLLRRGGDPTVQDQDGNTALDLALLENNRRCVVALQEYERIENTYPGKMHGYLNNDSYFPDDFPEMSSISLLLESTYEMSPFCSTNISPFKLIPKNGTAKEANDAKMTCQTERTQSKFQPGYCDLKERTGVELLQDKNHIMTNKLSCNLKSDDSSVEYAARTSEMSNAKKDYTSIWNSNNTNVNNLLSEINEHFAKSNNTHTFLGPQSFKGETSGSLTNAITSDIMDPSNSENVVINEIIKNKVGLMLNNSSTLTQLKSWEGLDVTSPDHVYSYSRGHSNDDLENTLVLSAHDGMPGGCGVEKGDESSVSKYTSCSSEGFTSLEEKSCYSENRPVISHLGSLGDINTKQVCGQNGGFARRNSSGASNIEENNNNHKCSSQLLNQDFVGSSVNKGNHEMKMIQNGDIQCASPSLTLPVDNGQENYSQDLQRELRNLMLSTKNCGTHVKDTHSIPCSGPQGRSSGFDTVLIRETSLRDGLEDTICPDLKAVHQSCHSPETILKEALNPELQEELKKMMLATKTIHPSTVLEEERKQCFFTPRAKSRLLSYESRHSSNSLFDDTVEMPQRGKRVRSPDSMPGFPQTYGIVNKNTSSSAIYVQVNPYSTSQPIMSAPESDSTVSISKFLTDDLSSSETDAKCNSLQARQRQHKTSKGSCKPSESVWLTEETTSNSETGPESEGSDCAKCNDPSSALLHNGSLLHSTLIEDATLKSLKAPRYSFSRLSCIPKADDEKKWCQITSNSISEEVPLSPGGRPINASRCEPVEYLYTDNDQGHTLIERHMPCSNESSSNVSNNSDDTISYDWRNYRSHKQITNQDSPALTPNRVAVELYRLSNDEIARRLRGLGEDPGQVTTKTRRVCIYLLDKLIKQQATSDPGGLPFDYSPELSLALRTHVIPDCNTDEAILSQEFDQPDKTKKWREGVLKSSFNYLLLDPRVTRNLPALSHTMSLHDCFRTFVQAIFYVGKGKRARPYCHLYESLAHYKGTNKSPCPKIQHIVDIWKSGQGVLSLHCFQNTIPVEAYTREACMVDAIGLKMLTNQKKGVYYGQAQNWIPSRRRRLGVHMLHRAMQIFIAEGERQLRPPDISSGR